MWRWAELLNLIYWSMGLFRFSATHCKNKRLWEFGERFGNSGQLKVLIFDLSKNEQIWKKTIKQKEKNYSSIHAESEIHGLSLCSIDPGSLPVTPRCQGSLWPDLWIPLIVMLSHKLSMEPTLHTIVSPTCRWHHMGAESRNFLTKMKNIFISSEGGKWVFHFS